MSSYAAIYAILDDGEYSRWIEDYWFRAVRSGDPLFRLRDPVDLRGEVAAWGPHPHFTGLDALLISSPAAFREIAEGICSQCEPPALHPECLAVLGNALAVKCASPALAEIRRALIEATSHLIERTALADEEWQRGEWWIDRVSENPGPRRELLSQARQLYTEAGCPPLPTSRHFRLGFLLHLVKRAGESSHGSNASPAGLQYFLQHGQPPWYGSGADFAFHTTIASGLRIADRSDRARQLKELNELLWPSVETKLGSHKLDSLSIMAEDPGSLIEVSFFDHLTDTYVKEQRPSFTVQHKVRFSR